MDDGIIRFVNWAPDSSDDEAGAKAEGIAVADGNQVDGDEALAVSESMQAEGEEAMQDSNDVRYVLDSLAGDTEVSDSLAGEEAVVMAVTEHADGDGALVGAVTAEIGMGEAEDGIDALVRLASTNESAFEYHKHGAEVCMLMLAIMLPRLYGVYDDDVCDAAARLLWIAHGYFS